MKIKTKEQYDARYQRRGAAKAPRRPSLIEILCLGLAQAQTDFTFGRPANHKARATNTFTAIRPITSGLAQHYGRRGLRGRKEGLTVIGGFQGCAHVLSVWHEDVDDDGRPVYFQRAMPCTVNHGWKKGRHGERLIPDMGEPGTHVDKLGRKW